LKIVFKYRTAAAHKSIKHLYKTIRLMMKDIILWPLMKFIT